MEQSSEPSLAWKPAARTGRERESNHAEKKHRAVDNYRLTFPGASKSSNFQKLKTSYRSLWHRRARID